MPQVPIVMPQLGESIAEATIISYLVRPGDTVEVDQHVIEIETNKAIMTVVAAARGVIETLTARVGESYPVGAVLGAIRVSEADAARSGIDAGHLEQVRSDAERDTSNGGTPSDAGVRPTVRGLPVPAHAAGAGYISPRLRARMNELGLRAADLSGVAGSGAAGRVTVE